MKYDNIRPSPVNVNALRIVHASLPARCTECNGTGQIQSEGRGRPRTCQECNGRGSRVPGIFGENREQGENR